MSIPEYTEVYVRGVGWVKKSDLERAARKGGKMRVTKAYNKELKSRANSVHPTQVEDYTKFVKGHGISGVRFDKKGNCYFSSRRARSEFLRRTGRMDMDGGYGDYTGK